MTRLGVHLLPLLFLLPVIVYAIVVLHRLSEQLHV
jgi:hypothetical protein